KNLENDLAPLSIGIRSFRSPGESPAPSRSTHPLEGTMNTTVSTTRATTTAFGALVGTGVAAAVAASVATTAVAAAGHGAGISLDMGGAALPVTAFGTLTAIF